MHCFRGFGIGNFSSLSFFTICDLIFVWYCTCLFFSWSHWKHAGLNNHLFGHRCTQTKVVLKVLCLLRNLQTAMTLIAITWLRCLRRWDSKITEVRISKLIYNPMLESVHHMNISLTNKYELIKYRKSQPSVCFWYYQGFKKHLRSCF